MSSVSSEHVYRLLSLILPGEPLKVAYRGLHSGDAHLKVMALEYLDSVVPAEVRSILGKSLGKPSLGKPSLGKPVGSK